MLVRIFFVINLAFALMFMKIDQGVALVNLACAIMCAIQITMNPTLPKKDEE